MQTLFSEAEKAEIEAELLDNGAAEGFPEKFGCLGNDGPIGPHQRSLFAINHVVAECA